MQLESFIFLFFFAEVSSCQFRVSLFIVLLTSGCSIR